MTVNEAVIALRKHVNLSQQVFATNLGMSISSLQNYEQGRTPEPKQLLAFEEYARDVEREDLSKVFHAELLKSLGMSLDSGIFTTTDAFESMAVAALLFCIRERNQTAPWLIAAIAKELSDEEREKFLAEAMLHGISPRRERK